MEWKQIKFDEFLFDQLRRHPLDNKIQWMVSGFGHSQRNDVCVGIVDGDRQRIISFVVGRLLVGPSFKQKTHLTEKHISSG